MKIAVIGTGEVRPARAFRELVAQSQRCAEMGHRGRSAVTDVLKFELPMSSLLDVIRRSLLGRGNSGQGTDW